MWLVIVSVLAVLALLAYLYGIFQPVTLYRDDLKGTVMLYYSFKGSRESLGPQFQRLTKAAEGTFKLSSFFGVYYSRPEEPIWKCVLGIMVNPGEIQKVPGFLAENPHFRSKRRQTVGYVGASMPYVNFLSFYLLPLKIPKFISLLEKEEHPIFPGIIQIYHFNFRWKSIEFVNPLWNHEDFDLFEEE